MIETTRCSSSQAEVALLDNENDVQRAILYILDRNGEVECWTEQKSRKAKKVFNHFYDTCIIVCLGRS